MQLRTARLCIDCEEVHGDDRCPVCASETFTYLSRWIPSDERRRRPRNDSPQAAASEAADVEPSRRLTSPEPPPPRGRQLLKKGVVGLAALGVVGWLWGCQESDGGAAKPPGQAEN